MVLPEIWKNYCGLKQIRLSQAVETETETREMRMLVKSCFALRSVKSVSYIALITVVSALTYKRSKRVTRSALF